MVALSPSQSDLAARYWPLARSLARPQAARWPGLADELISAASVGLCEAARIWDASRRVAFATFARLYITRRCLDVLRQAASDHSRRHVIDGWDLDGLTDPRSDPRDHIDALDAMENQLRRFPPQHAEVLRLLCRDGLEHQQVAARLRKSRSRISYIVAEARVMVRDGW